MCIRDSYYGSLLLVDAWAPWQPLTGVNAARNFAAIIIPACGYGVSFLGAEEHVRAEEMRKKASMDPLTGLKNRRAMLNDIQEMLETLSEPLWPVSYTHLFVFAFFIVRILYPQLCRAEKRLRIRKDILMAGFLLLLTGILAAGFFFLLSKGTAWAVKIGSESGAIKDQVNIAFENGCCRADVYKRQAYNPPASPAA